MNTFQGRNLIKLVEMFVEYFSRLKTPAQPLTNIQLKNEVVVLFPHGVQFIIIRLQ